MKTLTELMSDIKTEMQLDPGLISDKERVNFINDALDDLGSMNMLEKPNVRIQCDKGQFVLPDDFKNIISVIYNGNMLPCIEVQADYATAIGNPTGYFMNGKTAMLYPHPDTTSEVEITYTYTPKHMESAKPDETPDIPEGADRLLIYHAVALAHRKNGNIMMYREYMTYYESKKNDLMYNLLIRRNTRVVTMGGYQKDVSAYNPFNGLL